MFCYRKREISLGLVNAKFYGVNLPSTKIEEQRVSVRD